MLLLAGLLAAVITLYITEWLPIEVTSILIIPVLYLTGILDLSEAFSGFSSSATITIASMFVLSAGLTRTGVLEVVTLALARYSRDKANRFLLFLALVIPLSSAFMNNTPVVVMMVPVVLEIARKCNVKASKFLIPLSYFAILGGTCTLIGTSTNILVDELYQDAMPESGGFSMFEFAPLGLILTFFGCLFILFFGRRLLPEKGSLSAMLPRGRTASFVTEIVLEKDSALCGKKIGEIFDKKAPVRLLEVVRQEELTLAPQAQDMELEPGDALIIEGASADLAAFLTKRKVVLSSVVEDEERVPMRSMEMMLGEAVVLPKSPFIGRQVAELGLNRNYGVKVLAVQRRGKHHRFKIRNMYLRPGDVMLLQAGEQGFSALKQTEAVLIVEGLEKAVFFTRRAVPALIIMAAVILLATLTPLPIAILAFSGAVAMILSGCLHREEAFRALDPKVLLLLAGAIPLGLAMTKTGMAALIVDSVTQGVSGFHPAFLISAIFLLTSLVSQVLSNNATAILMTPLAIQTAQNLGPLWGQPVSAKPFLMAIIFGASASFMSPVGYQTNAIVMGPGGYNFRDYLRIGIPMTLLLWVLSSLFIPLFWPVFPG